MKGEDGGFLAAVLGGTAGKNTADFADQRAFGPQRTGGIQKLAHLPAHIAKTRGGAENHGIGPGQFFNGADRYMGKCLLSLNRSHFFKNVRRQSFRHSANFDLRTGNRFSTLGNRFCHFIYMPICRIKND